MPKAAAPAAPPRIDLKTSRLSRLLGFQLRLAQVAVFRDFMAATAGFNLTPKLYAVLELIGETPGVSQVDLAQALSMDRASMMALIDRLDDRGLIMRAVSRLDRRRQALTLSADGEILLMQARAAVEAHEARLLGAWTPQEIRDVIKALRRLQQASLSA